MKCPSVASKMNDAGPDEGCGDGIGHFCMWNTERHPMGDVLVIGAATQQTSPDMTKIHRCQCGAYWIDQTRVDRRIQ